jgi:hypothetical protein
LSVKYICIHTHIAGVIKRDRKSPMMMMMMMMMA